jgi:hypothetical protein
LRASAIGSSLSRTQSGEANMTGMSALWARTGLIWFLGTMAFGMYLGLSGQFGASSAHAHLGLLGWLSSIAFAWLHNTADPEGALAGKGRVHWALHNLGLVAHATGLWLIIKTGNGAFGPMIGVGGGTMLLANLWLAAMLWGRLRAR